MSRKLLGVVAPLVATAVVLMVVWTMSVPPSISKGITAGLSLAFFQSVLSVLALEWSWEKKFVYWGWGGGIFFRMGVFAGTAFVVYRYTSLSFVSTMVSMVVATTAFLVVESSLFFG